MSSFIFIYQDFVRYLKDDGQKIDFKFYFYQKIQDAFQINFTLTFATNSFDV